MINHQYNFNRRKLDLLASRLTSLIFDQWVNEYKQQNKTHIVYHEVDEPFIEFSIEAKLKIKGDLIKITNAACYPGEFAPGDEFEYPHIEFTFEIGELLLPHHWEFIHSILLITIRHEIEHLTQSGINMTPGKAKKCENEQLTRDLVDQGKISPMYYFKLDVEIDANLQSLRLSSSKLRILMMQTIMNRLYHAGLTDNEMEIVIDSWRSRSLEIGNIPMF